MIQLAWITKNRLDELKLLIEWLSLQGVGNDETNQNYTDDDVDKFCVFIHLKFKKMSRILACALCRSRMPNSEQSLRSLVSLAKSNEISALKGIKTGCVEQTKRLETHHAYTSLICVGFQYMKISRDWKICCTFNDRRLVSFILKE